MIAIESVSKKNILPYLPLMHRWTTNAFKKPPYLFEGQDGEEVVSAQDTIYVNEKKSLVLIAKKSGEVVGISASIDFDSKLIKAYFRQKNGWPYEKLKQRGFDPLNMLYITYILTREDHLCDSLLIHDIYNKIQEFAVRMGKKQLCYMKDVSYLIKQTPEETPEPWMFFIDGFHSTGVVIEITWPTKQKNGLLVEQEHKVEFFSKDMQFT